ncbi:MAG: NADH-quinone oxidoreductase subunit D [Candidatus Sifarchaeia archaeon]
MSSILFSVGPQHSGSGHFRLKIELAGDIIIDAEPDPGFVHRSVEKIAETREYLANVPLIERQCLADVSSTTLAYAMGIEELLDIEVPPRAQYIRIIMCELSRIMSHLYWMSIMGIFLGHSTVFMWPFGDRDIFIDIAERIAGSRVSYSYIVPGGVRYDLPDGIDELIMKTLDYLQGRMKEYDAIFFSNPIFKRRTEEVGVFSRSDAIQLGVAGPTLRASGVRGDIRKDDPYSSYEEVDFEIPVLAEGDAYSRCLIRFKEMEISSSIIKQALEKLPNGDFRVKVRKKVPEGEVFSRVEAARGELSCYIVSDGSAKPYRLKMSTPSFRNLPGFSLLKGSMLADMPAIYWSLDYWPLDADR